MPICRRQPYSEFKFFRTKTKLKPRPDWFNKLNNDTDRKQTDLFLYRLKISRPVYGSIKIETGRPGLSRRYLKTDIKITTVFNAQQVKTSSNQRVVIKNGIYIIRMRLIEHISGICLYIH